MEVLLIRDPVRDRVLLLPLGVFLETRERASVLEAVAPGWQAPFELELEGYALSARGTRNPRLPRRYREVLASPPARVPGVFLEDLRNLLSEEVREIAGRITWDGGGEITLELTPPPSRFSVPLEIVEAPVRNPYRDELPS